MARVRGRTQCSGGRCVQRSESEFGVSWNLVTKGGPVSHPPLLGRRTRDRRSLATSRRVVSGARLFPASCDGRNVLVARVTVRSRAMFVGSPQSPQVEQSNRIPP